MVIKRDNDVVRVKFAIELVIDVVDVKNMYVPIILRWFVKAVIFVLNENSNGRSSIKIENVVVAVIHQTRFHIVAATADSVAVNYTGYYFAKTASTTVIYYKNYKN